jgi:lysophospholipase L1-like esterase
VAALGSLAGACTAREGSSRAPAEQPAAPAVDRLPDSDEGLPGAGPIRRYDWFRQVWQERHDQWSRTVERDQRAVVFVGDSITQGWGDDMGGAFPGTKVANRGISGDTTRGILIRLGPDVLRLHPSAVVILAGTNDIEEGAEPQTIAGNMRLIVHALRESDSALPIVLCEVFPSSAREKRPRERIVRLNGLYADIAKREPRVTLLATWALFADEQGDARASEFPDLLHPNKAGYEKWASLLRPALADALFADAGADRAESGRDAGR